MIAKLRRIAIYSVSDDSLVVLTTVQDGVEGAGGFFYTEEEDTLLVDDDQTYTVSFLCRLDARLLANASARTTLFNMVGDECIISGVGIDGFVQFGRVTPTSANTNAFSDTVKIVAVDQVDTSTVFRITAQRRSTKAYVSGVLAGSVGAFNSLLNVFDVSSGTAGVLYGHAAGPVGSRALINKSGYMAQSFNHSASGNIVFTGRYLFPFDIPITLGFTMEAGDPATYAKVATYTGTTTVTEQSAQTRGSWDGDSPGDRLDVTITPTTATRWVGAYFGVTGAGSGQYSRPTLRVAGLTGFEMM